MKVIIYDSDYKAVEVIEDVKKCEVIEHGDGQRDIKINDGLLTFGYTIFKCIEVDDDYPIQVGDIVDYNLLLEKVKQEKIKELDLKCEATILAGFMIPEDHEDPALAGNYYSFDLYDQLNFNLQVTYIDVVTPTEPIYWKTENKGILPHTIQQFMEVCKHAERHKRGNIEKYWALKEQVMNCQTVEEVEAITWEESGEG